MYIEILVDNRHFNLPHVHFLPPLRMTPIEFREILGGRKLGYDCGASLFM